MSTAKSKARKPKAGAATDVVSGQTVAELVNELHNVARSAAVNAVEKAIECGQLLVQQKDALKHGEFQSWIERSCVFPYRTASHYMRAARAAASGLPFSSLNQLYGPAPEEAEEKTASEKKRKTLPEPTQFDADLQGLLRNLEDIHIPAMSPEQFVAEAGPEFLTKRAAERLKWLVELFDTVTSVKTAA